VLSRGPRCFSPWEQSDGRDRSLSHPAGPARYAAGVRLCIVQWPRLCYRRTSPGADNSKRGLPSARPDGGGLSPSRHPNRSAPNGFFDRWLAELTYRVAASCAAAHTPFVVGSALPLPELPWPRYASSVGVDALANEPRVVRATRAREDRWGNYRPPASIRRRPVHALSLRGRPFDRLHRPNPCSLERELP
jgi:hypothetical protein